MVENWIGVEDDTMMVDVIIDEDMYKLDNRGGNYEEKYDGPMNVVKEYQ